MIYVGRAYQDARLHRIAAEAGLSSLDGRNDNARDEFEELLIYTQGLPCNRRGVRLMDVLARFLQNPGHTCFP